MRNDLPETCFATRPGMGDLIILKRGETGYYRSDWETGDKNQNQEIADLHNRQCGITPAQVMAMQVGSIAGFDVPGANPQTYYDEARFVCSAVLNTDSSVYKINMELKAPSTLHCCPIKGNLHLYQVAGKESLYLDVLSVPEILMGKESSYIILPDMVGGKPLVPVCEVDFDTKTRTRIAVLGSGSYSKDKEVNAGFGIIAKVQVGPVEYALGEHGGKFPSFVTWERTPANDGAGPPNYYWGHYFDSREKAVSDFCQRAEETFKMLHPDRKPSIKAQLVAKSVHGDKPAKKFKEREAR